MRPPRSVFHGTDACFAEFDQTHSMGAHFGSAKAAQDRLRSTSRAQVTFEPYEDDDGQWWAIEEGTHNRPRFEHGPFEDENTAQTFCDLADTERKPLEFEIDVFKPLMVEDLGTWTFENVTRYLHQHHPEIDASTWYGAWNRSTQAGWDAVKTSLKEAGYDCIAYTNLTEDPGSISWIVWDNTKIHRDWRSRMAMDPQCLNENDYGPRPS